MKTDWVDWAASYTLDFFAKGVKKARRARGRGIEHAKWLLVEVATGQVKGNKAHRWLGYAQAILVEYRVMSLNDAKNANKKASDELDVFNTNQGTLGL